MKYAYIGYIPSDIRYDEELTPRDKLIYCEITATIENGYCKRPNSHFGRVAKAKVSTISASITRLRERGYIKVIIEKENNTQKFMNRYIYLTYANEMGGVGNNISDPYASTLGGVSLNNNNRDTLDTDSTTNGLGTSYYTNKIKYIYSDKKATMTLDATIPEDGLKFLKKIVSDFYMAKHKQFPEVIREDWHIDKNLAYGSVNTLYNLIKLDRFNEHDIKDAIHWATTEKFWSKNLMSLRGLREKSSNGLTKFQNLFTKFKG